MRITYKGFMLDAHRESIAAAPVKLRSMIRPQRLYYSATRISDGWTLEFNNTEPSIHLRKVIKNLKFYVDEYLRDPQSWQAQIVPISN